MIDLPRGTKVIAQRKVGDGKHQVTTEVYLGTIALDLCGRTLIVDEEWVAWPALDFSDIEERPEP